MSTPETLSPDETKKMLIDLVNAGFDCGTFPEEDMLKSDAYDKLHDKSCQLTDEIYAIISSLRTRLAEVEKELAQEKVIGKSLSDIIEAQGKTIESEQLANAALVKDKERLLNVLEHCALDPDKQSPEQYKVARNVTKEYRQAIDLRKAKAALEDGKK